MTNRVLIAGASGRLGRHLVREFKSRGYFVRALARDPLALHSNCPLADECIALDASRALDLRSACSTMGSVISCMGASVIPSPSRGRATFSKHDFPANRRLIDAARSEEVEHFVYLGVHTGGKHLENDFVSAHEDVSDLLMATIPGYAIVRATGFYGSIVQIMRKMNLGLLPVSRRGQPRTNPIHEADLAEFCANLADDRMTGEFEVGGPEVLTRREIADIVLSQHHSKRAPRPVPIRALSAAAALIGPINPRMAELYRFIAFVLSADVVAPAFGSRTLHGYVRDLEDSC